MDWEYNGNIVLEIPEKNIGFVYCITNLTNNKKYIGKKLCIDPSISVRKKLYKKVKTPTGRPKLIPTFKTYKWQNYWGSSIELKKDIKILGKENFKREVLIFCPSKFDLAYKELKLQLELDVLLNPENFYNGLISVKLIRPLIKNYIF